MAESRSEVEEELVGRMVLVAAAGYTWEAEEGAAHIQAVILEAAL